MLQLVPVFIHVVTQHVRERYSAELTAEGESSKPGAVYASMALELGLPVTASPFGTLAAVARHSADSEVYIAGASDDPKSALEVLLKPDWREWMHAIKKEHDGWIDNGVYSICRKIDMEPNAICVDIREVYTIKRDGTYKGEMSGVTRLLSLRYIGVEVVACT